MATGFFKKSWALGLILIFASAGCAQTRREAADPAAPPVEHASFHQLVFANEDFAVLNNRYPPGGDSEFHTHYRDIFYVVIQSAPQSGQRVGQPLTAAPLVQFGAAGYSANGLEPRVHRIVNSDEGPSQFIVVELRRPGPRGDAVSSRESPYVQIVDNERMRAWRLVLEPGQSVPIISQGGNGIRVVVRGGLLTTSTSDLPDQTLFLRAGDFAVQNGGSTRALRNTGTETIELVEIELK
jgi:quercetin dioxygenase-like cupin family protein